MAYAPSWRAVMKEDVMAKLDLLIGMVAEIQTGCRSFKGSPDVLPETVNAEKASNTQRERIARMEGRPDEQSRILEALIRTRSVA
jgi:hypothetical protein